MSPELPFLNKGVTFAVFHSVGTVLCDKDRLIIIVKGVAIVIAPSFCNRGGILSMPAALLVFSPRSSFNVYYSVTSWNLKVGWRLSWRDSLFLAALFSPTEDSRRDTMLIK